MTERSSRNDLTHKHNLRSRASCATPVTLTHSSLRGSLPAAGFAVTRSAMLLHALPARAAPARAAPAHAPLAAAARPLRLHAAAQRPRARAQRAVLVRAAGQSPEELAKMQEEYKAIMADPVKAAELNAQAAKYKEARRVSRVAAHAYRLAARALGGWRRCAARRAPR